MSSLFLRSGFQWPYLLVHGGTGAVLGALLLPLAGGDTRKRILAIAVFAGVILLADLLLGYGLQNQWQLPRMVDRLGDISSSVLLRDRNRSDLLWPIAIAVITAVSWWLVVRQAAIRAEGT